MHILTNWSSLNNFTSSSPPRPIPPVAPDFLFCHSDYGAGLSRQDALFAGSRLPRGDVPFTYPITSTDESEPSAQFFQLPLVVAYGGTAISVETASPTDIDRMVLRPDDIRGMAGYVAEHCIGARGIGGWITKNIQGAVDYVTDPNVDLDLDLYPHSTAFVTLTISTIPKAYSFPGDYDPAMAVFLQRQISASMGNLDRSLQAEMLDRVIALGARALIMRRLGTEAWWEDLNLGSRVDKATATKLKPIGSNINAAVVATSRRRKRFGP